MEIIRIDDLAVPELAPYARLTEAQLLNRLHPEEGLFICESMKVIRVALEYGMEPVSFLCEEKFLPQVEELFSIFNFQFSTSQVPVYTAPRGVLKSLTGYELSRGILCAMRRPKLPSADTLLSQLQAAASSPNLGEQPNNEGLQQEQSSSSPKFWEQQDTVGDQQEQSSSSPKLGEGDPKGGGVCRRIAVLDGVVNSENTGAIFRAAAALGIDAVLLTRTCCDPLNRRACRVSMGTVFQLPWTFIDDIKNEELRMKNYPLVLKEFGFETVAMALTDRSVPVGHPSLKGIGRMAIILGTEGDGLSDSVLSQCDHVARIPMQRGVDSLNVAAAAAVAFYELCR